MGAAALLATTPAQAAACARHIACCHMLVCEWHAAAQHLALAEQQEPGERTGAEMKTVVFDFTTLPMIGCQAVTDVSKLA